MDKRVFKELKSVISEESKILAEVQVPMVTVSATYRKELLKKYHCFSQVHSEAIFSRAHYSMAEAVRQAAQMLKLSTHVVDPTNFVATNDWSKIDFTEYVGQRMARNKILKRIKDHIDSVARSKLPITDAITQPLQSLVRSVEKPVIAMHYEAGNIVAREGKRVIQVITDPHVRPQYLNALPDSTTTNFPDNQITFAVFDQETKNELLETAMSLNKQLTSQQVEITGPPVDPRIVKIGKEKETYSNKRPLQIAVTTGGLGTNLVEVKETLDQLVPLLTSYPEKIRFFLYAGTHRDFRNFYESYARHYNIRIGNNDDTEARIRILYEDSIVDANENLIEHMFPWADVVITKPSGDIAYETIASGAVPLFLEPWGEWEVNIQKRFTKLQIGFDFQTNDAHDRLVKLIKTNAIREAQKQIHKLEDTYTNGAKNIVRLQQKNR